MPSHGDLGVAGFFVTYQLPDPFVKRLPAMRLLSLPMHT